MDHDNRQDKRTEGTDCPRTLLAENGVGSVEVCSCGMWQLHIGPLTLRLAPCAVSELLGLLGQAVVEDSARRFETARELGLPLFRRERGEA
jgi:hypothetical protein